MGIYDSSKKKFPYNMNIQKIIKAHNDYVTSISIFPSGKMISVSTDKSINIYDINYNIYQKIKNAHNHCINSLSIKDENNFATCSSDNSIKTWIKNKNIFILNKIILNAHDNIIWNVIYNSNGNLFSCSPDNTVKIWEEKNNNYQLILTLNNLESVKSLLLIESKNKLISSGLDGTKIWNLNNYELIKYFKKIKCGWYKALNKISEEKIIVGFSEWGGPFFFIVISISKLEILIEITLPFYCFSITVIHNKELLLISGESKDLLIYNYNNFEFIQRINNLHDDRISGCIELKNGLIASFSWDKNIKIWSL